MIRRALVSIIHIVLELYARNRRKKVRKKGRTKKGGRKGGKKKRRKEMK